jgi:hypothetical protein
MDNNGIITKSIIDSTRFDNRQPGGDDDCYTPQIVHIYDMVYAIVYRGEYNAYVKTLRIGDLGDISTVNDDYLLFDGNGYEPQIINVGGDIFAIPFRGSGSNAMIKTVEIRPQLVTSPRIVVNKQNAYGLKANATTVYGYINGLELSAPISSTDFNYVVLTYNQTLAANQMKLYVDSVLRSELTYSSFINSNGYHLFMCQDYNCIIDEVTLWNVAISDTQILDNYNLYKP